jgi:GxxExxY protein
MGALIHEALCNDIIAAAIQVHRELGPGLLESAYEACMAYELESRGVPFQRQVPLPLEYLGHRLECGYRMDLVVAETVSWNSSAWRASSRFTRLN